VTILPGIPELQLFGTFDRGVPSKERVVLKPAIALDVGAYVVIAGARASPPYNLFSPLRDHMFWFGTTLLGPNDWIFLYTGHGSPSKFPTEDGSGQIYTSYWGHDLTIFHDPQVIPVIARLNGLLYEARPEAAAQPAPDYIGQLLALMNNPTPK
jgi:hypothetical protein